MGVARDIALVFLAVQALAAALVPLAFIVALAYGMFRLIPAVRRFLLRAQQSVFHVYEVVDDVANKAVSPLIALHASVAWIASMTTRILTSGRRSRR